MHRSRSRLLLALTAGVAFSTVAPEPAPASTITFQFTGMLTQVYDGTAAPQFGSPGGLQGEFGIEVGTPFTATQTFDSQAADYGYPGDPNRARYRGLDSSLSVGAAFFVYRNSGSGPLIVVENDVDLTPEPPESPPVFDPEDFYQWNSGMRPGAGSEQFSSIWVMGNTFRDESATAFDGDALLLQPALEDFDNGWFAFHQGDLATCHPIPWEQCNSSLPEYRNESVRFFGYITSWTVVPEPTSSLLLGSGLAILALGRRCARRRRCERGW